MRSVKWYFKRLKRYFKDHYGEHGEKAGWITNPAPNKWRFYILDNGMEVTLTCDDRGNVTEEYEYVD